MANSKPRNVDLLYCINHEKVVPVETTLTGRLFCFYDVGKPPCHGPFAECLPPPPLTEEEWDIILGEEYYRYAN